MDLITGARQVVYMHAYELDLELFKKNIKKKEEAVLELSD